MHRHRSIGREWIETLIGAVIVALFIRTFLFQAFRIPSGSMEPTLLAGDHLVVNRFLLAPSAVPLERALLPMREVRRGDIVVFKFPEEPSRDLIKRVIGLEGETVEVRDRRLLVDGRPLDEPDLVLGPPPQPPPGVPPMDGGSSADVRVRYGPVIVPRGFLFVMGDNRDNSEDSRYWGFLPSGYVKGKAMAVYWSFDPEPVLATGPKGWLASLLGHTRWSRVAAVVR